MRPRHRHRGLCQESERSAGRLSRMVEPALLYLLASGAAAHGYDLIQAANELGLCEMPIDAGGVYRCLRQLEEQGCVVSTWDTTGVGAARRTYELTRSGWERLRDWTQVLEQRSQAMRQFVKLCGKLRTEPSDNESSET